jgi:hypothetical protein
MTKEQKLRARFEAKRNLWVLGHDIMGTEMKITWTETTHKKVCEFFVKKDPSWVKFEDFARKYEGPHDRLLLLPRETFKSSIKIVDNVQWFLCWPNLRLFTFTAAQDLAESFINKLQYYFVVKGKCERDPDTGKLQGGTPTQFQQLFPELMISEDEARSGEFYLPHLSKTDNPSAGALSIGSTSSGWHCDLMDLDDVISDSNMESGNQIDKLDARIAMVHELLMNYGFRHVVGTRYHPMDSYGRLAEESGVSLLYGDQVTPDLQYMCRPCWWLKGTEFKQPDYKTWIPNEDDVDLFFPEGAPFKALRKKLKKPETFFSQQLNDPVAASGVEFTEELVRSRFIDHSQLPRSGKIFIAWDLAYSIQVGRDYSCGAVGLLDDHGRWWIISLIKGRYDHMELPFQIVNAIRSFNPVNTAIEDCQGARWLLNDMDRKAKEMGIALNIDWIGLVRGTEDAKFERMMTVHPLMKDKRIFFLNTIECADELVKEFRNVGQKKAKNDIPDAISRLTTTYSHFAHQAAMPTQMEDSSMWKEIADREFHDMIFSRGRYEPSEPEPMEEAPEQEEYRDSVTGLPSAFPI